MREVTRWLQSIRDEHYLNTVQIPFSGSREWLHPDINSSLHHKSGRFFSIKGVSFVDQTDQSYNTELPLIDQPEVGILGFLVCVIADELHILFQAKIEPGNIGGFQLAPTVQATESNYQRAHGGSAQPYFEYFNDPAARILHDSLQTEQGWKFITKKNRNLVVKVDKPVAPINLFKWVPISQTLELLQLDNVLNSDARSVLVCFLLNNPHYLIGGRKGKLAKETDQSLLIQSLSTELLLSWYNDQALRPRTLAMKPLAELNNWAIDDYKIYHKEGKVHEIIQIAVETDSREVSSWDQPIINTIFETELNLIARIREGVLELLLKIETQPGLINHCGVSVTLANDEHSLDSEDLIVQDWLAANEPKAIYSKSSKNSEEGGRFFHDSCIYNIYVFEDNIEDLDLSERYGWLTLADARELINAQKIITNELRSMLALLLLNY